MTCRHYPFRVALTCCRVFRTSEEPLLILSCLPGKVPELTGHDANASHGFPSPSSIAADQWEEVPAGGVYSLSLGSFSLKGEVEEQHSVGGCIALSPELHAWPGVKTCPLEANDDNESSAEKGRGAAERRGMSPAAATLLSRLRDSIDRRVRNIPSSVENKAMPFAGVGEGEEGRTEGTQDAILAGSWGFDGGSVMMSERGAVNDASMVPRARVGILFSGGLDSVVLAALLAEAGGREGRGSPIPPGEPIDLINVCFDRLVTHFSSLR